MLAFLRNSIVEIIRVFGLVEEKREELLASDTGTQCAQINVAANICTHCGPTGLA